MAARCAVHGMKRLRVCALLALTACFAVPFRSEALEPGRAAPPFELGCAESKLLRLSELAGSVVVMTLESRDTTGINQTFKDALLKAFPLEERLRLGIAVVPVAACFQYFWPANGICARHVRDSVKEVSLQLYVDMSGDAFRDYGARTDTSTVVIIDRGGAVRFVMQGKIPDEDVDSVVGLVRTLAGDLPQPQ